MRSSIRSVRRWTGAFVVLMLYTAPTVAASSGSGRVVIGERDQICSARCASEKKIGAYEYERCLRDCFATFRALPPSAAPGQGTRKN
jgi:hypothetical protein